MATRSSIASSARTNIRDDSAQIRHSLKVIAEGRRGAAEPDESRRAAVLQVRRGLSDVDARREALKTGPESLWGKTVDFVGVAFFERGRRAARCVCRITQAGSPLGTGFLISPHLVITNNHVLGSASEAKDFAAEFDYELDVDNQPLSVTRFALAPDQFFLTDDRDNLDYSVIALGQRLAGSRELASYGALPLSNARNKHALGDFVNIIQHPDGRLKEAVVRENELVGRPSDIGTVLHYVTDTEPGSSGSPVFNVLWDVVALHHWGGPHRDLVDAKGVRVPRTVNEGIRISAIFTDLNTRKSTVDPRWQPLLDEALTYAVRPVPAHGDGIAATPDEGVPLALASNGNGSATWQIPLVVSVHLGNVATGRSGALDARPLLPQTLPSSPRIPASEAKLTLDPKYSNRSGYRRDFLPGVAVDMPKLSAAQKKNAAANKEKVAGDLPFVLRYEHFTIVMNKKRRLAFFTATNIDGASSKDFDRATGKITEPEGLDVDDPDEGPEATELWLPDRRIDEGEQTPPDLFSGQTAFHDDASKIKDKQTSAHRNRIFQQGHLTRRQDPLWGKDDVIRRANTDTFHVTNRSPQIGYFNMGTRHKAEAKPKFHPGGDLHWRALEEFVLANARADKQRVSVFTGPVLDDAHDFAWDRGRTDMKGFKAPRKYWKLVLRVDQGKLHATSLVADQSPLIDFKLPEALEPGGEELKHFAFDKVKKFQTSIAKLETLTGLDFGAHVRAADTFVPDAGGGNEKRVVNVEELSIALPKSGRKRAAKHPKKPKR
jgi:endonuclease G, mitochondrial